MRTLVLLIALFSFHFSGAQKIITTESEEVFRNGTRNCIGAVIYRKDLKNIVAEWQKYLKQFKYEAITEIKNEVDGHNLFFKNIINKPVDIYTAFEFTPDAQALRIKCAIDIGASNYLKSSNNLAGSKEQEKMVRDFAVKMTRAPYEELLAACVQKQNKLMAEQRAMEKEINSAKKNLVNYDKKLAGLRQDSSEKLGLLTNKNAEIEAQKKITDTIRVKESDFAKNAKKILDRLNSQKADAEKDLTGVNKKITDMRNKINTANTDIKVNGEFIVKGIKEMEAQKIIAEDLKKKLADIS